MVVAALLFSLTDKCDFFSIGGNDTSDFGGGDGRITG
jgi:hypothetical protein